LLQFDASCHNGSHPSVEFGDKFRLGSFGLSDIETAVCQLLEFAIQDESELDVKVDLSKEANRFVGWAVSNLIKKTRKQFNRSKGPPQKVDQEELIGRLELGFEKRGCLEAN
jgi:hypothetical protein